jgi:hypothetical protein
MAITRHAVLGTICFVSSIISLQSFSLCDGGLPSDPNNAALLYYQAFLLCPEPDPVTKAVLRFLVGTRLLDCDASTSNTRSDRATSRSLSANQAIPRDILRVGRGVLSSRARLASQSRREFQTAVGLARVCQEQD